MRRVPQHLECLPRRPATTIRLKSDHRTQTRKDKGKVTMKNQPSPQPMRKQEFPPEVLAEFARQRAEDEKERTQRPTLEAAGFEALQRLYAVANDHSGQCRYVARFLLGLYNGRRFPFDLTDLRGLDRALFEDCMTVLRMDARVTSREVHTYFDKGGTKFEALAERWRVQDVRKLEQRCEELEPVKPWRVIVHGVGDIGAVHEKFERQARDAAVSRFNADGSRPKDGGARRDAIYENDAFEVKQHST